MLTALAIIGALMVVYILGRGIVSIVAPGLRQIEKPKEGNEE